MVSEYRLNCISYPNFCILTFSKTTNFRLFQTQRVAYADDIFKFDENGKKLLKQVENTVGKGEIAHYEQFSFSHNVFKRLQTSKKPGLVWERLKKLLAESEVVFYDQKFRFPGA